MHVRRPTKLFQVLFCQVEAPVEDLAVRHHIVRDRVDASGHRQQQRHFHERCDALILQNVSLHLIPCHSIGKIYFEKFIYNFNRPHSPADHFISYFPHFLLFHGCYFNSLRFFCSGTPRRPPVEVLVGL